MNETQLRGDAASHFAFRAFFRTVFFLTIFFLAVVPFFFGEVFFFLAAVRFAVFLAADFVVRPPNADDQLSEYFSVVPLCKTVTARSLLRSHHQRGRETVAAFVLFVPNPWKWVKGR